MAESLHKIKLPEGAEISDDEKAFHAVFNEGEDTVEHIVQLINQLANKDLVEPGWGKKTTKYQYFELLKNTLQTGMRYQGDVVNIQPTSKGTVEVTVYKSHKIAKEEDAARQAARHKKRTPSKIKDESSSQPTAEQMEDADSLPEEGADSVHVAAPTVSHIDEVSRVDADSLAEEPVEQVEKRGATTANELDADETTDYLSQENGFISIAACQTVFGETDYTRLISGSDLSNALTGVSAAASIALERQEIDVRQKIRNYLNGIAENGPAEAQAALAQVLSIPNASDRFLKGILQKKLRNNEVLTPPQKNAWDRVKELEPIEDKQLFGTMMAESHKGGSNYLYTLVLGLTENPILSKIPFLADFSSMKGMGSMGLPNSAAVKMDIVDAVIQLRRRYFASEGFNDVKVALVYAGKMKLDTVKIFSRETDSVPIITYARTHKNVDETVEIEEERLTKEHMRPRIYMFFETFKDDIDFKKFRDPEKLEFIQHGLNSGKIIEDRLLDMLDGNLPIERKEDLHYGRNFPKFSDLSRIPRVKGISPTSYPFLAKKELLIDQINEVLRHIGYENMGVKLNDARLKALRDVLQVLNKVKIKEGAFGEYLGDPATEDIVRAHNAKTGKKSTDEGFLPEQTYKDSILFDGKLIRFDYNAIEDAIKSAKEAAERFGDSRISKDFDRMMVRLSEYIFSKKTSANMLVDCRFVETGNGHETKPLYCIKKRELNGKAIYEIAIPDDLMALYIGNTDKQQLRNARLDKLNELKKEYEDAPYCENLRPAIVDEKLLITNPPPFIADFLNERMEPAKGVNVAMEELNGKAAQKNKKFQLGKVAKDPKTGKYSTLLLNPEPLHPKEKATFYSDLIAAIGTEFPKEKYPELNLSIARAQHLAIEGAPYELINTIQAALGISTAVVVS